MKNFIIGYFSDRLSPKEWEEVREWMSESPEKRKPFLLLQKVWFSSVDSLEEGHRLSKDGAYEHFFARAGHLNGPIRREKQRKTVWQMAAVVALLLATFAIFHFGGKQEENISLIADTHITAPSGSRVETTLPDGTIVWLNTNSRLTYSQDFGVQERRVYLTGEGYFEVAHNEALPMIVHAGDMQINVIGTKFNVRNYTGDSEITVSLVEGKISITNNFEQGEEIMVEPDQKLFFNRESGNIHLTDIVASYAIDWIKGYLFYDEELLSDIVKDLERHYDVQIIVHPNAADLRFFCRFNKKEMSIEKIVEALSFASGGKIKYSITGKDIFIKKTD